MNSNCGDINISCAKALTPKNKTKQVGPEPINHFQEIVSINIKMDKLGKRIDELEAVILKLSKKNE